MKINEKNLCVFATNPPFDCEGWLNKRGEVNKAFQRRYFVLKGNLLFYFEKKGDKEPLGLIIVEGCTIELSDESNCDQYCFEIAFNGNRTYVLSADSQDSMETWMKALTCAGYEYKKLMVAELQRQLEEIEGSRNKLLTESNTPTMASVIPRPPPRRQNPFNRPAPPLPGSNSSSADMMIAPAEFVNGHFGSTSHRSHGGSNNDLISTRNGVRNNPTPPPRALQASETTTRAGKSEFYQPVDSLNSQQKQKPQGLSANSAKTPGTAVFNASTASPNHGAAVVTPSNSSYIFEKMHEHFRQLIMKDILDYRAQHGQQHGPLIEL